MSTADLIDLYVAVRAETPVRDVTEAIVQPLLVVLVMLSN
ncbi:uncharacterized protein Nmag_0375 [Natrialba magadii ATCC 43099]|uniref:Uncharacterized protein n=1 Tax=Natrialba magadii (strain ATCC 43099 / DSM 3394 / CCM 3739 / CIP 104546 / IAM 13178 / JCM 8861 / NBRC 102185 / NCIMB 2190 / MS3) TaxID=547559 RepID=D3SXS5_NATMM|nr:uncharacterized protein Nmag_0375 [Natrialba magadii ATCC 43099]